MARVLIVGCGYVGSALGIGLVNAGHQVWGLRTSPHRLPSSINPLGADVLVPNTLRHLPPVDYVYYLVRPREDSDDAWRRAVIDGPRYLAAALPPRRQRIRRFFFASSIRVYGDRNGDWVDEESEAAPQGFVGERAIEGERLIRQLSWPITIVRFGEIYGPTRLGLLTEVLDGYVSLGAAEQYANLIHRDDCASGLAHLLRARSVESSYVFVDQEPTRRLEVARWMAEQLNRGEPVVRPSSAGPCSSTFRAMSDRLVETGFRFRYPSFREGYRMLLSRV